MLSAATSLVSDHASQDVVVSVQCELQVLVIPIFLGQDTLIGLF
jgi:hypothetical protein